MCQTNDPNYKKIMEGEDFTLKVDDEYRERLINELRTYPNILLFCGDANGASHAYQGDKKQLAQAVASVLKHDKLLFDWLKVVMSHV